MFGQDELLALNSLLDNSEIPDEFYLYWNEAVNTIGYSPKLLVMFSALEALFKRERDKSKDAYYKKIEVIFGPELKAVFYGTKDKPKTGLRHRLVHGEYFNADDGKINYVEEIHNLITRYFNDSVFGKKLITESVVHPQRHLFGNKEGWNGFIKPMGCKKLGLKELLSDIEKNSLENMVDYETVYDEDLASTY